MSGGHPHMPTPHFDHDAKALNTHAAQNHRNALALNEDAARVEGWLAIAARRISGAVRWPLQRLYTITRD